MNARFRAGMRAAVPFAIAGGLLATSFGVLARDAGMPGWAAVLMSAIVFAGSAQIAALTIIDSGGGLSSAIGAAALMNSRFLPMGVAIPMEASGFSRSAQFWSAVGTSAPQPVGALIAFALVPVAPPGIPVLAASLASLIGLHARRRPAA